MRYEVMWGHSKSGPEVSAREASRYSAVLWGYVDADSAEEAVRLVAREVQRAGCEPPRDWLECPTGRLHLVW